MKFVLLTNMPNPHQMPLFRALVRYLGKDNVRIVLHQPMSAGREELGWVDGEPDSGVIRYWQSATARAEAARWIETADVVVQGRYPIGHVRERILAGKLTFAYQERLWKKRLYRPGTLTRLYRLYRNYWSVNRGNYHFLAAGAYAGDDVARLGCFSERAWKFGYFTDPSKEHRVDDVDDGMLRVLWCGRMMDVKRPTLAIDIIDRLVDRGIAVTLRMAGDGPQRNAIDRDIAARNLHQVVETTGMIDATRVAEEMNNADVFLFTSNRQDGWGVVVNEAMEHGCCVVASDQAGAPPWLIDHQKNGLLFDGGNVARAADQLARLAADPGYRRRLGQSGHTTIRTVWSADTAAGRLSQLSEGLASGHSMRGFFDDGPCSAV